jgi:peptidoglycan/LPS O-acetylase OafA/YrhL
MHKPQLDGLRFFFFFGVFLYHTNLERFWFGSFGVAGFFTLSGFLITNQLLTSDLAQPFQTLKNFYIRRCLRILPAYYLVLTLAALLFTLPYLSWHYLYLFNIKLFLLSLRSPLELLAFLEKWSTSGIHFWSLCIEEQFYLLDFSFCSETS